MAEKTKPDGKPVKAGTTTRRETTADLRVRKSDREEPRNTLSKPPRGTGKVLPQSPRSK